MNHSNQYLIILRPLDPSQPTLFVHRLPDENWDLDKLVVCTSGYQPSLSPMPDSLALQILQGFRVLDPKLRTIFRAMRGCYEVQMVSHARLANPEDPGDPPVKVYRVRDSVTVGRFYDLG